MIRLEYRNLRRLAAIHYLAVRDYVVSQPEGTIDSLYRDVRGLLTDLSESRTPKDFSWLRRFILADIEKLEDWVVNHPAELRFDFFKKLYLGRFAKDPTTFVDNAGTYNAYTFLRMMDFHVCPYCEDEYIDTFATSEGEKRTADIDHFYPKGKDLYPALAMCFFNLIPSGKGCNQVMRTSAIEANPYDPMIESLSKFHQDTPIDRNIDSLSDSEIKIRLDCVGKMIRNESVLGIENRYNNRKEELRKLFKFRSLLSSDNMKSVEKLGLKREIIMSALGAADLTSHGQDIHQKLRGDLLR